MPLEHTTTKDGRVITRYPLGTEGGRRGMFQKNPELIPKFREAVRLRGEGLTYKEIAAALGIAGKQPARTAMYYVEQGLKLWPGAKDDAKALRARENEKLDHAEAAAWEVIADPPYDKGSSGKVVIDPRTGEPQRDKSAVLRAVGQIVNLSRRRSALNGLDIPVETRARVTVTTEQDREIAALAASLLAAGRGDDVARSLVEALEETLPPVVRGELAPGAGQIGAEIPPPAGQEAP